MQAHYSKTRNLARMGKYVLVGLSLMLICRWILYKEGMLYTTDAALIIKEVGNRYVKNGTNYDHLPEDFIFLVNPKNKCSSNSTTQGTSFLVGVESLVLNFEQRAAVRQTWANNDLLNRLSARVIFLIGINEDAQLQKRLNRESAEYDDLVQGSFVEHFKNLTLKTIMFLRWSQCFCSTVKYAIKTDDDVLVNLRMILQVIKSNPTSGLYLGYTRAQFHVIRNPNNPYYTSYEAYPEQNYPVYASGPLYILSQDVATRAYDYISSHPTGYISSEDAFIGVIMSKLNVSVHPYTNIEINRGSSNLGCFFTEYIAVHRVAPNEMLKFWPVYETKFVTKNKQLIV
ncbi:beta-1,3-galactosyltransferase 1-like [Saccoglossus kowalevskii]|uniref:Hexosyltransferase n=1 Tax=Saccoglossus kowalevskii TaxID=10224 RepID=A0ABM0MSU1_SACKO|nr:PREDICTED: beta-1,3-galactosyltransferase 1-like [Saccoglossus kowalevskii]